MQQIGYPHQYDDNAPPPNAYETTPPVTRAGEKPSSWKGNVAFIALLSLVLLGAILGLVFGLQPTEESIDPGTSKGLSDEEPPTPEPTKFPTKDIEPPPSTYPTNFPSTSEPTAPTTLAPSSSAPSTNPTLNPTRAPLDECLSDDEVCGCNQVRSSLVDIIFLVDESGSVGQGNYDLMVEAVSNFVANVDPPMDPETGTRIAYFEFSTAVNDRVLLSQTSSEQQLINIITNLNYAEGGTDHRRAFQAARDMLLTTENAPRPNSALALVMMTDGIPCVPNRFNNCRDDSFEVGNGDEVLREIHDRFDSEGEPNGVNFTFYFLPIQPVSGTIRLDVFDGAELQPGDFVRFGLTAFEDLDEFLNGDNFIIDLGPCTEPPTVSEGTRMLLQAEAGESNFDVKLISNLDELLADIKNKYGTSTGQED